MILPLIVVLAIGTLVALLWWRGVQEAHQRELDRIAGRRQAELLRARQVQRRAEVRINGIVTDAMQQMAQAATAAGHARSCSCPSCAAIR